MKISLPATHGHKADPFSATDPTRAASVDWAKTMEFWHYQAGRGLGIAEAMNAARRGMGLDWPGAVEMICCTKAELPEAWVANRCGTDHLNLTDVKILNDLRRALVRMAKWPQDYVSVYSDIGRLRS